MLPETSIGAIVGALYASGYSPDEMEELFKSDAFYFWSTGQIQEEIPLFFQKSRKEDPGWIQINMKKKDDKLKFPVAYKHHPPGTNGFCIYGVIGKYQCSVRI